MPLPDKGTESILRHEKTSLDRRTLMTGAAALGVPAVAGCLGGESDEVNRLVSSIEAEIDSLDPAYSDLSVTAVVWSQVVESLFYYTDDLEIHGRLASGIEPEDGGESWLVELEEGVEFHPPHQREFVAEDVVANFERRMDPDEGTVWSDAIAPIEEVTAVDDYSVRFEMMDTMGTQDGVFARSVGSFIMSPDALEEEDDVRSNPVGTGPFKFEEWIPGNRVELSRFEDYWQEDIPSVDEVVFRIFDEPSIIQSELTEGNIHIYRDVPGDFVEPLEEAEDVVVQSNPAQSVRMLMCNTTENGQDGRADELPTTDINIRRAISEAIDREDMVELVGGGYGQPAQQHYTDDTPWHIDTEPHSIEADVDRAQELIEMSDFEAPVEINIVSMSSDPVLRAIGRVAEDMLSNAGFDPNLTEQDEGTWAERLGELEYDLMTNYQGALTIPDGLRTWYHSEDGVTQHYINEEVDELFELANSETDQDARIEYYEELQEILAEDQPNIFLFHPEWVHAHREEIQGYEPHTDRTQMYIRDIEIEN